MQAVAYRSLGDLSDESHGVTEEQMLERARQQEFLLQLLCRQPEGIAGDGYDCPAAG